MRKYDRYKLSVLVGLSMISCIFVAGCSEFDISGLDDEEQPKAVRALEATRLDMEDNSKRIVVETVLKKDIEEISLDLDSVTARCEERDDAGVPFPINSQPAVTAVRCTAMGQIVSSGIHMDVLVDLTLPDERVEAEKEALLSMRRLFPSDNMSITFMSEFSVTDALPASDYVINKYCVPRHGTGDKRLYRAISKCLGTISAAYGQGSDEGGRVLVVFSDGKVYSNNKPVDPEHFSFQEKLMRQSSSQEQNIAIYYVNFGSAPTPDDAASIVRILCDNSKGLYQESFNWSEMEKSIFQRFDIEYSDYTIELTNPDDKVYDGGKRILSVQFLKDGVVVADLETEYWNGTFYRPVIVNGKSKYQILWHGIVTAVGLLIFIFLMLQVVVPRICKTIFDRKYVTAYKRNMSVSGVVVDSSCYYCKAPFEPGDRIVARCAHTMHEQCWNENGYHCPEYGRNCKQGSHYYNPDNLLDPGNALFHMPWVLLAIVAGTLSWAVFTTVEKGFFANIITSLVLKLYKIQPGTPEAADFIRNSVDTLDQFPSFGLFVGVLLTLAMSILTVHKRNWLRTGAEVVVRSIVAGICGYAFFLIGCILSILLGNYNTFIADWIPWACTGIAVALCSSVGTSTVPRRYWIYASAIVGFLSMLIWTFLQTRVGVDCRGAQLWSHILFSVGIALSIAQASPVSERYFLHVSGAVKDMDIAIYKWFEANSNRVATIGRSVDCDLMMSWDVDGDIAPVQANLTKKGHSIYITPLEPGVMHKGRMLPVGKPYRLNHGTSLVIGKTELVYQEKDI